MEILLIGRRLIMIEDEKKIQEMAQLGNMGCKGKDCIKCQQDHPHEICWPYRRAKIYYHEGYRKADEVRKETIKEFIDFVKNVIYNYKPTVTETDSGIRTYHYLTDDELFDIIKERYEKEIKE